MQGFVILAHTFSLSKKKNAFLLFYSSLYHIILTYNVWIWTFRDQYWFQFKYFQVTFTFTLLLHFVLLFIFDGNFLCNFMYVDFVVVVVILYTVDVCSMCSTYILRDFVIVIYILFYAVWEEWVVWCHVRV